MVEGEPKTKRNYSTYSFPSSCRSHSDCRRVGLVLKFHLRVAECDVKDDRLNGCGSKDLELARK